MSKKTSRWVLRQNETKIRKRRPLKSDGLCVVRFHVLSSTIFPFKWSQFSQNSKPQIFNQSNKVSLTESPTTMIPLRFIYTERKRKRKYFFSLLFVVLNVSIISDSPCTHLEAMSLSPNINEPLLFHVPFSLLIIDRLIRDVLDFSE